MNMRKIIAVLAAVLMLCAIIPMSALSVSADGFFDFEGGTTSGWQSGCAIEVVEDNGSKVLKWDASGADWANTYYYGSSIVSANTDYTVSLRVKADRSTNMNFKVNNNWAGDTAAHTFNVTTEWQNVSFVINSGACTSGALLLFSSNTTAANGATYYLDDISFVEYVDPNAPIYSEDFEDGTAGTWASGSDSSPISVIAAADLPVANPNGGSYALSQTLGGYHYMSDHTAFAVEPNTDYVVTVDALMGNNNWPVQVIIGTNYWLGSTVFNSDQVKISNAAWTTLTYTFNSGDNSKLYAGFKSSWENVTVYFDNFKVEKYIEPEEPAGPEAIYSEDYESGELGGWTSNNSIVGAADLPVANADGGSYAMKFESTNYSYTNYQLTVEPNTDYKVTYSILSGTSGYPINARIRGNSVDLGLLASTPGTGAWETHTYTFNSGDYTSVSLRFQAGWATGTYYIDNISVVPYDASVMSNDGHVVNGTFETGDTANWANSAYAEVVTDPTGASQGYVIKTSETASGVTMFSQTAKNLKANTKYVLSFKVYGYTTTGATNSAFWVRFAKTITDWSIESKLGAATYNDYTPRINVNSLLNAWYDVKITFNTGDLTETVINFLNYRASNGYYYFDDITIFEYKEPSYDGYLYNGDFELGELGAWTNLWGSCPTAEVIEGGKDSDYALNVVSGKWKHVRQTGIAVEPNTGYKITAWAKNAANMSLLVKDGGDTTDLKNVGVNAGDEWTEFTGYFNSGDYSTIIFSLMGGADEAYGIFDNVSISLCEHEYDADCDADCNNCGATREASHSYAYPCDPVCQICYEITNPDAAHSIVAVEAKDATCTENGNIAYWYCEHCGACWADEALTQVTNRMSVVVPTIEHSYDNIYDAACNVCGGVREVPQLPVEFGGKSISEDVSGLAFKYDLAIEGVAIKGNTYNQADFTNATFNGHKLLEVGVIASNGQSSTKIQGVHMCELEGGVASFVYRVVNIPADKLDAEITMTPYYVVEIDGVETTVYGEAMVGSYAEIAG